MTLTLRFVPADAPPFELQLPAGQDLMHSAVAAGVAGILGDCGGTLCCATCHVIVHEPHAGLLPPMDADEDEMLGGTAVPRRAGSRLACQIVLGPELDGMTVELPATQY